MAEKFSIVLAFPNELNTKQNPVEIEKLEYPNDAHLFIINSLPLVFLNFAGRVTLSRWGG